MGSDVATSSHNWQACRCPSHPLMSLMKFGTEQLPNTDRPQNLRNKCLLTSKDISRKKEEERIRKLSDKNDKEQSCVAQLRVFYDIIPSPTSCASFRIIMNHFEKLYSVETKKLVHWLNVNRLNAQLAPSPVKHASEVQLPSSDRTILAPMGSNALVLQRRVAGTVTFSVVQSFAIVLGISKGATLPFCRWHWNCCKLWARPVPGAFSRPARQRN